MASRTPRSAALLEFVRYFACSALALAMDGSIYWAALRMGMAYQAAAAAGFMAGVATTYILSVRWAFRRRSIANVHVEFMIFLGIGLAGLGLTEVLLWLQISVLGSGPMVAKLVSAAGVFMFNFGARKLLLFTRRSTPVASIAAA